VLMSDGYAVYRAFVNRLRCWAHLARKIQGLVDSPGGHPNSPTYSNERSS
jgi:hypothetical protein